MSSNINISIHVYFLSFRCFKKMALILSFIDAARHANEARSLIFIILLENFLSYLKYFRTRRM